MATPERVLSITSLRACLGFACQQVALTGEPIIVQRYGRQDVALVPLWEWRFLKDMEASIWAADADPPPPASPENPAEVA